jgi:hypothetical protein
LRQFAAGAAQQTSRRSSAVPLSERHDFRAAAGIECRTPATGSASIDRLICINNLHQRIATCVKP